MLANGSQLPLALAVPCRQVLASSAPQLGELWTASRWRGRARKNYQDQSLCRRRRHQAHHRRCHHCQYHHHHHPNSPISTLPAVVILISAAFAGSSGKGIAGRRVRLCTAASGADDADPAYPAFDAITERWVAWRHVYPVRASGGVRHTGKVRPTRLEQREWCCYTTKGPTGRIQQEWWMPPFLVPIADVARVQGRTQDCTQKAVLPQFSNSPASGGPKTRQHYTNIFRVECLARSHPLVWMVQRHKETKALDKSKYDKFGRAVKFHQSPHDLRLSLESRVEMLVGCSVNGAGQGLLSLWWSAAPKCKHTPEQESLARAVFLDLAEAAHDVPSMYALPLARPLLLPRPRKRRGLQRCLWRVRCCSLDLASTSFLRGPVYSLGWSCLVFLWSCLVFGVVLFSFWGGPV